MDRILNGLVGASIGAALTVGALIAGSPTTPAPITVEPASQVTTWTPVVPWFAKRECQEEDSVNCAWNAKAQGNGVGHSFIVRKIPHTGQVCYLFAKRADRRFDFCTKGHR